VGSGVLCLLLISTVALRDALWIVTLCLLAAFAVGSTTLAGGRSVLGLVGSTLALPLAGVRGLPWLGRSVPTSAGSDRMRWWPVTRTVLVSAGLLLVFGALFASADALFAQWVGALLPDLTIDTAVLRGLVLLLAAGVTLAGVYVALAPPDVDRLTPRAGEPVQRFEWAVPVGLVAVVFAVFIVAQLTVLFGGHAYLRRTTGLTYADYVHQGFGQLTVATMLTLAVVAAAVRRAPRTRPGDRLLLRVLLGGLCGFTLLVVASALYRMHVYEEAYGFTRLRLLVSVFESWLGLVVALVLVAGVTLRGRWVPRAALLTGAAMLLGLAALNPDGYIAERNLERFQETGRIDWSYLQGLSADAVPALTALPDRDLPCVFPAPAEPVETYDWLEWNLGRARADDVSVPPGADCTATSPTR